MVGFNKVFIMGNLGRDPELRRTPSGISVASFTMATTERFTDKSGQRQEKTEWHNIVAWGKLAELAGQYLKKGRQAFVEGKITNRSWDDKDGNKKYRTEIVASQIQFIGGPGQQPEAKNAATAAAAPAEPGEFDMPDTVAEVDAAEGTRDDLPF